MGRRSAKRPIPRDPVAAPASVAFGQTRLRILVAALLIMLAGYAGWTALKPRGGSVADVAARLSPQAHLLAAQTDARMARLHAAAEAGEGVLRLKPDEPLAAAEAAARSARALGLETVSAAVVGPEGVTAQTGSHVPDGAWSAPPGARPSSRGPLGRGLAWSAESGRSRVAVFAALPPAPQGAWTGTTDLVTLSGEAERLDKAMGVDASTIRAVAAQGGLLALSGPFAGRSAAVAQEGSVLAAVSGPSPATGVTGRDGLLLAAPVLIGALLLFLLLRHSSRQAAAGHALDESARRFRLAVEAARCGIWEWRLRDRQMVMSDVMGAMLGWGGAGVVSTDEVLARITPEHRERVREALAAAATFGSFDVSFGVHTERGPVWIDCRGQSAGPADESGYATLIGVALDATQERAAQLRAQAAETRLQDAIESVSDAFALWDRHGRLMLCNAAYRTFFHLEPRILKPGASRETIQKVASLAVKTTRAVEGGGRELELIDGRWVQMEERRTSDRGWVVTAADVTELKRRQEASRRDQAALSEAVTRLEASQDELIELAGKYREAQLHAEAANKAKSEFLANMSHELRTPLNAVIGFSEIMTQQMFGPLGDPRYIDYVRDIHGSGEHLLSLINDILDMAKIEAGKLTLRLHPVDLAESCEDAVRFVRHRADTAGLILEFDGGELPVVQADERALKQVLLNLLSNAVKFTPPGGRVRLWSAEEGSMVRIAVTDSGIGIAPEDLARLGKPFEQIESQHAKTTQGTGLGLALTKSLVAMQGGEFQLESEPGRGTTASFTLPLHGTAIADQPTRRYG